RSEPTRPRHRGALCTIAGMAKAASIIAEVHRPLIISQARAAAAAAARTRSDQFPALASTRGSARSAQLPICSAETNVDIPNADVAMIVHVSIRGRSQTGGFTRSCLTGPVNLDFCFKFVAPLRAPKRARVARLLAICDGEPIWDKTKSWDKFRPLPAAGSGL